MEVNKMSLSFVPDPVDRINKRLPMPYSSQLPDILKRNYGKWVNRKFHENGIIEHISETGESVFTIKIGLPPNSRISTDTLKKIIDIADTYGVKVVRATRGMNIEFFAGSLENARKIVEEMAKYGFPAGGWGNSLWHITSCTAYLTCSTFAVDAPSVTKVLYDNFMPYFTGEEKLPSKLMIFVSGCTNVCAGTLAGDIVVVGHWGQAPKPDPERIKFCLPTSAEALKKVVPDVEAVCPVNAIKLYGKPDGSVGIEVDEKRCIACGRCKNVCDYFDWDPNKIGVAIFLGGKTSNTGSGPRLGYKVVPWIPVNPPDYKEIVAVVRKIVNIWKENAKQGERIGDMIDRIGIDSLMDQLGVPKSRQNSCVEVNWNFGVRQFINYI
jgi:sulfite reductase beta subunit